MTCPRNFPRCDVEFAQPFEGANECERQIIGMIKEQEAGMPTAEVCRKHGLSQGTFYKYKSKYGGMEVSDVAKLRAMEDENARLKRLDPAP